VPLTHEVRFGFEYGVLLGDQARLERDGSQVRYVSVRSPDAIVPNWLVLLIVQAALVAIVTPA
jgi:hypothetical protein